MQFQIQQLETRINQLQRELSNISSQIQQISSVGSSGMQGGISTGSGFGGSSWSGSQQGYPSNIASHTPSHSSKAGVGDFGQSYGGSGMGQSYGGQMGSGSYGGQYGAMGGMNYSGQNYGGVGFSGSAGLGGSNFSNIASYTSPSPTAGDVVDSPLGRQDYGIGGGQQPIRTGQY